MKNCSTPFRSKPIGESEPDAGCSLHSFYFHFIFQKCHDPNPWPDLNGRSEPELGLFRPFSFILSKHFILEFSITRKYFIYHRHKAFLNISEMIANDRPINIYIYTNTFTLRHYMPLQKGVQNNIYEFNSFDYKISMFKNAMYAHIEVYCNTPKYTLVVFDMFRVIYQCKFNCFIS